MFTLKHPSATIIAGPSQSGKTTLAREIVHSNIYFPNIRKVKWCYSYVKPWFLKEPSFEFIRGLPDSYEEDELIVIDDLMRHLNNKIADLFTGISHNCCVSVILILQNLFPRVQVMRDISLNAHYLILFKNSRDPSQVYCFGRQLYPGKSKFFNDAYIKSTSKPFGYLFIDVHPTTDEVFRLRESLFPGDFGLYWFFHPL